MSKVEDFLTAQEEAHIVSAIKIAEQNTSGEIRVHIEKLLEGTTLDRAVEVFHFLHMDYTKDRNGVLLYIAVDSKQFAIIGDKGINARVPQNFWASIQNKITGHFKQGAYAKGIEEAVLLTGEKLKAFFPYDKENDENELPDTISKGN